MQVLRLSFDHNMKMRLIDHSTRHKNQNQMDHPMRRNKRNLDFPRLSKDNDCHHSNLKKSESEKIIVLNGRSDNKGTKEFIEEEDNHHHSMSFLDNKKNMEQSEALKQEHHQETHQVKNLYIVDNLGHAGLYTGSITIHSGKPHGEGRMDYGKMMYEGQWTHGDWCGFGHLTNKQTGDVYQGGFFDNMRHGKCVIQYSDKRTYDGTFWLDKMGKGKMVYADGSTFWGYYDSNSIPHGRGKFDFNNGSVFDGEFEHGIVDGHGRMTWRDGRWYLGEWSNGRKNGLGIEVMPDGSLIHEGAFRDGKAVEHSTSPESRKKSSNGSFLVYPSTLLAKKGATSNCYTLVGPMPQHLQMNKPTILETRNRGNETKVVTNDLCSKKSEDRI